MALEDIVSVTITAASATPTLPGFGTPLIAAFKVPASWGANLVRTFSALSDLTTAGFLVTDPAYLAAQKILSQNPRPKTFKIGKRTSSPVQSVTLTVTSAVLGDVYVITAGASAAASLTYTVPGAATLTTVAAAIAALINALSDCAATSAVAVITVTPKVATNLFDLKSWSANLLVSDNTPDPGITADLAAIYAFDNDWYGLVLVSGGKAQIVSAAAWVEANQRLMVASSADTAVADSASTTDVAFVLKNLGYKRTGILFSGNQLLSYGGAAWMGAVFPYDPGKLTWAFKALVGISVDNINATQFLALKNKNCNFYSRVAGLAVTQWGTVASGEYIDVTHFIDWLQAQLKIQVFAAFVNNPKIPYTKAGINMVVGIMRSVLRAGVRAGGLADDGTLFVTAPDLADIDAISKGGRLLPNVAFGGTLAGAIHSTTLVGTLSS